MDNRSQVPAPKKRTSRACDLCRRKKIRCDGAEMPENRCSGCIDHTVECTYEDHNKRRAGAYHYTTMENRLSEMETKLDRANAGTDNPTTGKLLMCIRPGGLSQMYPNTRRVAHTADEEVEQAGIPELAENVAKMSLNGTPPIPPMLTHYHGRSSLFSYVVLAKILSREVPGNNPKEPLHGNHWKYGRPAFWKDHEKVSPEVIESMTHPSRAEFPPKELMRALYKEFFESGYILSIIFDRVIFDRRFEAEEYKTSDSFAGLLFTILALTGKITAEPFSRPLDQMDDKYASGDRFANIVQPYYRSFPGTVTLDELQGLCLFAMYQFLAFRYHPAWVTIGIAVRHAQDVGAHRKRPEIKTREAEFWKRTCWATYASDCLLSMTLGRTPMGTMDDLDIDLPEDLDDDSPLIMSYCRHFLRANRIASSALHMLYSVQKPRFLAKVLGDDYDQTVVAELDSLLNEWTETITDELRWNPEIVDRTKADLSGQLQCIGYNVRQLIHRPFIPRPGKKSPLSFPSLAICTNAARSCANVLNVARQRGLFLSPGTPFAAFTSAVTLLISTMGAVNSGIKIDYGMHVGDIDKCFRYLLMMEEVFVSAGKHADILREIASLGGVELSRDANSPPPAPLPSWKRTRDDFEEDDDDMNTSNRLRYSEPVPHQFSDQLTPALTSQSLSPPDSEVKSAGPSYSSTSPESSSSIPSNPAFEAGSGPMPTSTLVTNAPEVAAPMWNMSGLEAMFAPPDLAFDNNSLYYTSTSLPNPDVGGPETFGDPAMWYGNNGDAGTLGGGLGAEGGESGVLGVAAIPDLNQEALGIWSFAPPTFGWEQWGNLIDSIKEGEFQQQQHQFQQQIPLPTQ